MLVAHEADGLKAVLLQLGLVTLNHDIGLRDGWDIIEEHELSDGLARGCVQSIKEAGLARVARVLDLTVVNHKGVRNTSHLEGLKVLGSGVGGISDAVVLHAANLLSEHTGLGLIGHAHEGDVREEILGELVHARDLLAAGRAPGGPELKDVNAVILEGDRRTLNPAVARDISERDGA